MFICPENQHTLTKNQPFYCLGVPRGRIVVIEEACPPADTGSGRGPTETSGRQTTQDTLGGSGVSEANGVLR